MLVSSVAEENENIIEKPTKPQNFFRRNKLSLLPCLLRGKRFWPGIFPSDVVPFLNKGVGHLFAPWMTIQENGSSTLCDVISVFHSRAKQAQTERELSFFTECLIRVLFLDVITTGTQKMAEPCTEYTFSMIIAQSH